MLDIPIEAFQDKYSAKVHIPAVMLRYKITS